ncbi:BnaA09g05520D [Brassica napus]|uniref:BnaA09g05520D protein n=2 Tax=Brassica TaxID=3705 RepID=A0A078FQS4_BRANA|nr:BnaA09g05520D [Brassica napus]
MAHLNSSIFVDRPRTLCGLSL